VINELRAMSTKVYRS